MEKALIYDLQFFGGREASSGGGTVTLSERNRQYFDDVVKGDIKRTAEAFDNSKNETEKNYYSDELDLKMQRYSNALNVNESQLRGMITGKTKIRIEKETARPTQQTQNTQRRFINSYGEATSRYITTGTYERAQKRLTKAINNWMRGR